MNYEKQRILEWTPYITSHYECECGEYLEPMQRKCSKCGMVIDWEDEK